MANGNDYEFDLVTIGAGSGGTRASRFSAQYYGAKTAIVELPFDFISSATKGGAGGTCVIRGCVPKKLLVYASQFAEEFDNAVGFGWVESKPPHDWKKLISNKGKEIKRLNGVYESILKSAGVERVEGRASLVDKHTVEVELAAGGTRRLTARNILLATGSYAYKMKLEGSEHAITSDEALHLENLPSANRPILIVGTGYIGVEHAGIFSGLGAKVHLMYRADKVLRGFDEEMRAMCQEHLEKRGVTCHPGKLPTRIVKNGEEDYTVFFKSADSDQEESVNVGLVMLATGRKPRTRDIGLEAVGVQLDDKGAIKVDEHSRCVGFDNLWSIGDATNRINLTPVALMEGMAFAKTCFGKEPTKPDYQFVASAVFCQPPMATVGWTEEAAIEELCGHIDVYTSKFKPMKFTMSGRDERTLMKLIVHQESDRVIGCHMVGPEAPEIVQGLAIALKSGATKKVFDSTVGIHPTAAEEFVTMRSKARSHACKGNILIQ